MKQRELVGTLHIAPQPGGSERLHFLRTKEGNYWLVEVEPERVRWLNGLEVVVKGRSIGTTIEVRSIAPVV